MEFDTSQIEGWVNTLIDLAFIYGPPLLLGLIILIVGLKVIAKIHKLVSKAMQVAGISESLVPFLSSVVSVGLKIVLFLAIASIIGINIASFVAILAAASFAVGLALQGSLSNFAAGIIILIFRPYKVDQWIEVCDKFGRVEEIQIFNTLIVTPGNKTLIIPNGQIVDNIVTNFSEKGHVRIELAVSMPYGEDFPRVESIIMDVLRNTPGVLSEPAPTVGIETFDSHNIILTVRPFVNPDDYWPVTFDVNRNIKAAFNSHNVQVSYSEGIELGPIGKQCENKNITMQNPPFHLAFPVTDLAATRSFYADLIGCKMGRSAERWIDFDFFGHQLSAHLVDNGLPEGPTNQVDGKNVPVQHFGAILDMDTWNELAERLRADGQEFIIEPYIRFKGEVGEQATMFLLDPSGNALEFKGFKDKSMIFATK